MHAALGFVALIWLDPRPLARVRDPQVALLVLAGLCAHPQMLAMCHVAEQGADVAIYLALLPEGATQNGLLFGERKELNF